MAVKRRNKSVYISVYSYTIPAFWLKNPVFPGVFVSGIFLSVLGILNIKGNISTIHSYNRRKVKEEDIPKYGKAVGTGTVIMGASLILAYFATFWNEAAIDYIIFPAITIGLAFILYGQIKYNHGIF